LSSTYFERLIVNNIVSRDHEGILIVNFQDVRLIDEPVIQDLGAELVQMATTTKLDKFLLNFENVKFMASSMLGKLTMLRKKCIEQKVDLRMCSLTENIKEVFGLMKLDTIMDIYENEDAAFTGYQKKKKKWYV